MELHPVQSSHVEAVGYDAASRELHVQYKGGQRYIYLDVPESVGTQAHTAKSPGRFLMDSIKGRYKHRLGP